MEINEPLDPEESESLINSIAKKIIDRRLETACVLFLEMNKPLSFLASQSALVAMPFLGPVIGAQNIANFSRFFADRNNIDKLIDKIEYLADERQSQKTEKAGIRGNNNG